MRSSHSIALEVIQEVVYHLYYRSIGVLICFSQVNRAWRSFLLSDHIWKWFDVHKIRDSQHTYTYQGYQLHGIAAHYMSFLASLDPSQRARHLKSGYLQEQITHTCQRSHRCPWGRGCVKLPQYCLRDHIDEPYDQMMYLCFLWHPGFPNYCPKGCCDSNLLTVINHSVLEQFWSFPAVAKWCTDSSDSITDSFDDLIERNFYIYLRSLAFCDYHCKWDGIDEIDPRYTLDWDINMFFAQMGGLEYECAEIFRSDRAFMTELIRRCPWYFGAIDFCCEPAFVEHVLHRVPSLLDFLEANYFSLPACYTADGEIDLKRRVYPCSNLEINLGIFPEKKGDCEIFVKAAIKYSLHEIQHASKELRDSESLALFLVENFERQRDQFPPRKKSAQFLVESLHFCSDRLLNDCRFALKAIKINRLAWYGLSPRLQQHPRVMKQSGLARKVDEYALSLAKKSSERSKGPYINPQYKHRRAKRLGPRPNTPELLPNLTLEHAQSWSLLDASTLRRGEQELLAPGQRRILH